MLFVEGVASVFFGRWAKGLVVNSKFKDASITGLRLYIANSYKQTLKENQKSLQS